jgi:hypothetical protein
MGYRFCLGTLSDFAGLTITDKPSSGRKTAVTIDIFGLQLEPELLCIKLSRFAPGFVIIGLSGQVSWAIRAYKATIGDHFFHSVDASLICQGFGLSC